MKKKGGIGFLIGIFFCLMMVMPSFVDADVTIDGNVTDMVDLEDVNLNGSADPNIIQSGTTRNAYVDSSGNVATYDNAALWASVNGWSINVDTDRLVAGRSGSYYGILFNSLSDGSGTFQNGTVTNYGRIGSVSGTGIALGTGTITNYGSIIGYNTAIDFNGAGTGTAMVTNNADSLIHSNNYNAIDIYNVGTAIVTNSGEISSKGEDAVYIYSDGAMTARIQNNLGGTIDGSDDGIHFESAGAGTVEITNAGTITGDWGNGIYIYSEGPGTFVVNNTGTIQSYDSSNGSEALYISGHEEAPAGTATVTNSGLISAYYSGIGIEYLDSATVTNNVGGKIESSWENGVYIHEVGTATVNNYGTIRSYDDSYNYPAIYIGYGDTATVNNYTGGMIEAVEGEGVYIEYVNTATINNYGTIENNYDGSDDAVYIHDVGTVTVNNYAGGLISSTDEDGDDGIDISYANIATVNNYGKIYSGCETAVYIHDVGTATVNNYAGGLIQATEEEAVEIYDVNNATVNNYGRIEGIDEAVYIEDAVTATVNNTGTIVSHDNDGIYYTGEEIDSVGTVQVTNSGTINANDDGIDIRYANTVTVNNNTGGSIQAHDNGVYIEYAGTATVTNSGTITTNGWDYYNGDADDAYGISIIDSNAATVTNSGTINAYAGNSYGIYGDGYDSYGGDGVGIVIDGELVTPLSATVTNSGTINAYGGDGYGSDGFADGEYGYDGYGGYGGGIGILYVDTATVTNNVGGTINGYGGDGYGGDGGYAGGDGGDGYGSYAAGVYIQYAGTATVTNSGTISGSSGKAYGGNGANAYDGGDAGDGGDAYGGYNDSPAYNYSGIGVGIEYLKAGALVTNNAGGIISGYGGDAHGGDGGYGPDGGYGGYGGDAYGGDAYGIFIAYTDTATADNSGTINAYGGDAHGGNGGGGYYGGDGGYAQGGDAYGIFMQYVNTDALVTNKLGGTINATGGDAYGGNGGNGYYGGGGYPEGRIHGGDAYGIFMQYADTATVTNSGTINATGGVAYAGDGGDGGEGGYGEGGYAYGIYINSVSTDALVTNNAGGIINARGGDAYGGDGGFAPYAYDGSRGYGGDAYGIYMEYANTATVDNSGAINAYGGVAYGGNGGEGFYGGDGDDAYGGDAYGVYIYDITTNAAVTNKVGGIINARGGDAYGGDGGYGSNYDGYGDDGIGGDAFGIYIYDIAGTATVTNSGTINATGGNAYYGYGYYYGDTYGGDAYGIYINNVGSEDTVIVTNNVGGTINAYGGDGDYYGYGGDAYGVYIYDAITATVTNSGTINAYGGDTYGDGGDGTGIHIQNVETASVTNYGTINGYRGYGVDGSNGYGEGIHILQVGTAEVTNKAGGTIYGDDFGVLIQGANERTVTNENGGTISGEVGIGTGVGGSTRIYNYGKIESTDGMSGRAIVVRGYDNQVTLGTGTEIIGNIVAVNSSSDNLMYLDGQGSIHADQMQGFASMEKTGAGTWTLTGDKDYNSDYSGHSIYVDGGVLALGARGGIGPGYGVATNDFTQNTGASLGYAVNATGSTGQLTVYNSANFNNGTITVIPAAGTYAPETIYEAVLNLNGNDPTNKWLGATSTSAFLSPTIVEEGTSRVYDLILTRLSFTTATTPGTASLGTALDGLYDTATGDLRTALDELILVSPGDVEAALAGLGGGSYPAFQFMSFNGLGKYLGVLNNHIGTGGAFASNNQSRGMAWYGNGMQLAMAGGNSMSDAAPAQLAAAGNIGQTQIASGNRWGLWIDGYASVGNRRSDEIISKYKQTLFGGMLGFDVRVTENMFLGISGGISNTELKFDELQDNGRMDSYHGSAYLCYNGKPWYAEGVFTYAYNRYDMDRFINLGPIHEIANGDFSGKEFNGYAEVGYKFDAGGVIIRPLAAFQVDYLTQEAFTETGSSLNLVVDDQSIGSYQSFLGLNVNGPIRMGASAVLIPELRLKWAHEFSNDDHLISARFAAGGSDYFTVKAEELSRDTAIIGVGMNLKFNKHVSTYIQYDAELNKDFINHTGLLGLRLEW